MENDNNNSDSKQINLTDVKKYFFELFNEFIHLDHGVDKHAAIREIKSKQSMGGANAWMLMCSIMIASIGLNLDSQAVIIGAMLISPLMAPILGIGTSVAINDRDGLYDALMHFGAAILIALVSSTVYFWLTPLDEFTQEIQSRTTPTFLDVLIAVFGGIAGIISIARKDVSTTMPGVAIATALMPPLCVTGFGLANGHYDLALKAFYLFFLNSFFVAFATYVLLRVMKFPFKVYETKSDRRKNMIFVGIFSLIMIIPSFFIFIEVYSDYSAKSQVEIFIDNYIGSNRIYLDDYKIREQSDGSKLLLLKVYGEAINDKNLDQYESALDSLGLVNMSIKIIPTTEIKLEKVKQLESEILEVGDKLNVQLDEMKDERKKQSELVAYLKSNKDNLMRDSLKFIGINKKLQILMPEVKELGLATVHYNTSGENDLRAIPTVVVKWRNPIYMKTEQLKEFLKLEYGLDTLKIIQE